MEGFIAGSVKDRSFLEVPDARKRVNGGTFEQAPDGPYAGEWFDTGGIVSIFGGGRKPWELAEQQAEGPAPLKPGFEDIFGPAPRVQDFPNALAYRVARNAHKQAHSRFIGVGVPGFVTHQQIDDANDVYAAYGMGPATYYQDADGWWARFLSPSVGEGKYYEVPEGTVLSFRMAADTAARYAQLTAASFQVDVTIDAKKVDATIDLGQILKNGGQKHPLLTGVPI